jgi:hypothetical protein
MGREGSSRSSIAEIRRTLVRVANLAAPGLFAFAVFVVVSKPLPGEAAPGEGPESIPSVCTGWHRGDGESRAFDLARTEQGYREFKEAFAQSLSKSLGDQVAKAGPVGYDAGLGACGRGEKRSLTPAGAVPEALRGRRLWFFAVTAGRMPRIPEQVKDDPDLVPLVAKVDRVEDLAKVSTRIGRSASLAPKGLGEALGLRCVPALVAISKEGKVEVHEDP